MSKMVMYDGTVINLHKGYDNLTIKHVAWGLSKMCLFQSQAAKPITLAQNAVLVSRECAKRYGRYQVSGLLHNAHYALIGNPSEAYQAAVRETEKSEAQSVADIIAARVRLRFGTQPVVPADVKEVVGDVRAWCLSRSLLTAAQNSYSELGDLPIPKNIEVWDEETAYVNYITEAQKYGIFDTIQTKAGRNVAHSVSAGRQGVCH